MTQTYPHAEGTVLGINEDLFIVRGYHYVPYGKDAGHWYIRLRRMADTAFLSTIVVDDKLEQARVACKHCRMVLLDHADGGQCLYSPTRFESWVIKEYPHG
jgi:hypothetical protein